MRCRAAHLHIRSKCDMCMYMFMWCEEIVARARSGRLEYRSSTVLRTVICVRERLVLRTGLVARLVGLVGHRL